MKNRILFIGSQCVNKQSQDLACEWERLSPTQLTWMWSMNMIKNLCYRFEKFFGTFSMLVVEKSSETWLYRHFFNHVFRVRIFANEKAVRVIFFSKYSKFNLDFRIAAKNWEKVFFVSEIIACELVSLNFLYEEQDTFCR